MKDTSKMERSKDLDMNTIQTVLTIWATSLMGKEKERASFSGTMEKYMMESGKTIKKMAVAFGKALTIYPTSASGITMSLKDSEFWFKLE